MSAPESNVSSRYGAPMGRGGGIGSLRGLVRVRRVRLDSGGYDPGGAYFGIGGLLYYAYSEEGYAYFRAPDRAAALRRIFGTEGKDWNPEVWPSETVRKLREKATKRLQPYKKEA